MSGNVPDDWNCYWHTCHLCGSRYHASEGGCDCDQEEMAECPECGEYLDGGVCPECGRTLAEIEDEAMAEANAEEQR